jgi:hypothetical protein
MPPAAPRTATFLADVVVMTVRRVMEDDDKGTERAAATRFTEEEEARVLATLAAVVDNMMIGTNAFFSFGQGVVRGIKKKILRVLIGAAASTLTGKMMVWIFSFCRRTRILSARRQTRRKRTLTVNTRRTTHDWIDRNWTSCRHDEKALRERGHYKRNERRFRLNDNRNDKWH